MIVGAYQVSQRLGDPWSSEHEVCGSPELSTSTFNIWYIDNSHECSLLFFEVYWFWETERERARTCTREKRRERIPSMLHAVSTYLMPKAGLDLWNSEIMTKTKRQTLNWLSHPGTPLISFNWHPCFVTFRNIFPFWNTCTQAQAHTLTAVVRIETKKMSQILPPPNRRPVTKQYICIK